MTTTISLLGSTGSIGTQTLDVVAVEPDRFEVVALAAGSSIKELAAQAHQVRPRVVALADDSRAHELAELLPPGVELEAGPDALAAAEEEPPDLVVLDLMMPGLDGIEVCRRLRRRLPGLPVVMLTALGDEADRVAGLEVGADLMLYWVLWTGGLGALGCAIAGGHPLSILGAFASSPFTPLHPALASGTVSGLIEAWVRKPTYADFLALRDDVQTVRGWWRNRVARVLVNFFLTSMGTAIGVWTGGARMLAKLAG